MAVMLHSCNIGMTGSGKTYHAQKEGLRFRGGAIFFNPKCDNLAGYISADGNSNLRLIGDYLRRGLKINYKPDRDRKRSLKELDVLVEMAFSVRNILFISDESEIHGYQGKSFSPLYDVAERGRSYGVQGLFVCQNPAGLDKTILRNCDTLRVFKFNEFARKYFLGLGYNVQNMLQLLQEKPYQYILLQSGEVKGVFRE